MFGSRTFDVGDYEGLDKLDAVLPVDFALEHVGHVEEARLLPCVQMRGPDPLRSVEHGHLVTRERNHLPAVLDVKVVQDRACQARLVAVREQQGLASYSH